MNLAERPHRAVIRAARAKTRIQQATVKSRTLAAMNRLRVELSAVDDTVDDETRRG